MGYLFWFTETEALLLASLSRYLNTGVTACLLVLAGFGLTALGNLRLRGVLAGTAATALLWVVLTSPWPLEILDNIVHAPDEAALTVKTVAPYHEIADRLRELPAEEDGRLPVYLIAQQDAGLAFLRANYELAPLYLDEHATSIGSPTATETSGHSPVRPRNGGKCWANPINMCICTIWTASLAAQFLPLFDGDASIVNGNLLQVETTDAGVHLKVISTAEADTKKSQNALLTSPSEFSIIKANYFSPTKNAMKGTSNACPRPRENCRLVQGSRHSSA